MKLRRLSLLVAAPLLFSIAGLLPVRCFAQSETDPLATSTKVASFNTNAFVDPASSSLLSALADPQQAAQAGSGASAPKAKSKFPNIGVGVKVSTLGIGVEAAIPVTWSTNVRVGFNDFSYRRDFTSSGIAYNGKLALRSVTANFDWFFLGPLHLSPGVLLYDGNHGTATASVAGGQTFSLGGVTYASNVADPVTGNAALALNKVAPELLIGVGNMVPRGNHHFSVHFEIGAVYQGAPRATLNLLGSACAPNGTNCQNAATNAIIQSNVQAQQLKLNKNLAPFRYYPVVSLGFSYKL